MPRTLLLIRHAKAAQGGPTDELRELASRGENDARAAGEWLLGHGPLPTLVIVSSAVRAQQTWAGVASVLPVPPAVLTDARIYDNTVESLLAVIHDAPAGEPAIALVGHNPSIHELTLALDDGRGDPAARAAVASSYPTNGIATFQTDVDWAGLGADDATLRGFIAPRA
jgi:phosphohistidine phosphatase